MTSMQVSQKPLQVALMFRRRFMLGPLDLCISYVCFAVLAPVFGLVKTVVC